MCDTSTKKPLTSTFPALQKAAKDRAPSARLQHSTTRLQDGSKLKYVYLLSRPEPRQANSFSCSRETLSSRHDPVWWICTPSGLARNWAGLTYVLETMVLVGWRTGTDQLFTENVDVMVETCKDWYIVLTRYIWFPNPNNTRGGSRVALYGYWNVLRIWERSLQ